MAYFNSYLDYLEKASRKQIITEEALYSTIKQMKGAIQRLERYVDCVKDIQKIEDVEIKKECFNLKEYITDIINDFSLLSKNHERMLECQDQTEIESIYSDKDMLFFSCSKLTCFNSWLMRSLRIFLGSSAKIPR